MKKHIDKEALAEAIKLSKELTDDQKADIIGLIRTQKKYGLVWEDSPEEVEEILKTQIPILREVENRAILKKTDKEHNPNHIIIEGDNLQALVTLTYTHAGKIDVIYIDPPYNTGKKDEFKYNDYWVDSEDCFRHSKWLSFMQKRLSIAKQLLKEDGLLFISIDDNEIAQLKMLCDEIYCPNSSPEKTNSLGILIWDLGSGTSAGHFTRSHEYLLVYCKNRAMLPNFGGGEGIIDDRAIKKESLKNSVSEYTFKKGTKFEAPDGFELKDEWGGNEKTRLISGRMLCFNNMLVEDVTLAACWTQRNQMDSFFKGKETFDSKGQHVIEFYFRKNGKLYCRKKRDKINPPSVLRGIATTKQGSSLLKEIFNNMEPVSFVKPINLIKFLISLKNEDSIILDFFAGSGTTLHATMQLNADDGGHRQCILVTNNENNICEEVTYERNKRVIEGYTTPKGTFVEGLKNNNLRYYQIGFTDRESTHQSNRQLMISMKDLLCIKEDIYNPSDSFGTLSLEGKESLLRCFTDANRQMLMVYDTRVIPFIVREIEKMEKKSSPIKIYLFADGAYPYTEEFRSIIDKVELIPLPYAYRRAIKSVLPDTDPEWVDNAKLTEEEQAELMAEAVEAENNESLN